MSGTTQLLATFLLNSFWQIPVIAIVASLCSILLRRAPSDYRHLVWVAALALCMALPITTSWVSAGSPSGPNAAMSSITGQSHGDQYLEGHLVRKSFSFVNRSHIFSVAFTPFLTFLLLACYAAFFFWRAVSIGSSLRSTLKFRQSAYPRDLPARLTELANRYAKAFAVPDVAIVGSSDALGPVTLSLPRPVLILPGRFFVDISESDFSSAICHELAHIRRHDFLLNLLYELVSVPVSFHPGLLWIKKRVALTRELACDEAAATKLASRSNYARSLLSLAQSISFSLAKAQSNAALGLFDSNILEERIMNLLRKQNRLNRTWLAVLAVVASSLFTVASVGISAFSLSAAPSANVSGEVRQFIGTWTAVHDDTPYLILELHSEKGLLVGGIKVCSFNLDMNQGTDSIMITDKSFTEVLPARNFEISGKSLSFVWKDPDGDENHFKLEVIDANAGRLHWIGLPSELKVAPIVVIREKTR